MSGSISHLAEGNNALFILQGSVKVCMEKTDIEFYNGLTKMAVKCWILLENSETLEDARTGMESIISKVREKNIALLDMALD